MSLTWQALFSAAVSIGLVAANQGNVHTDLDSASTLHMPVTQEHFPMYNMPSFNVPGRGFSVPGSGRVHMMPEMMVPQGLQPLMHRADGDMKLQNQAVDAYQFGKHLKRHLRGIYGEMWAERHPNLARVLMTSPQWLPAWLAKHRFMRRMRAKQGISEMGAPEMSEDIDPAMSEGMDPEMSEGTDPEMSEGTDPEMSEGTDPEMSEDDDLEMSRNAGRTKLRRRSNAARMSHRNHKSNADLDDGEENAEPNDGEEIVQFRMSGREGISKEREHKRHVEDTELRNAEFERIQEEEAAMQESADTLEGLLPDADELDRDKSSISKEPLGAEEPVGEEESHNDEEFLG